MIILRNFLYLDTEMLHNYLSTAEGYLTDEINLTERDTDQIGGKVDLKIAGGSKDSESVQERQTKGIPTDPALFQRLYEILDNESALQYLEAFDKEIWDDLRRNEILEVQARIRVPAKIRVIEEAQNFAPWVKFANTWDSFLDQSDYEIMELLRGLNDLMSQQPIPLIFEGASTEGFYFTADLKRKYVRCETAELQGEATVFGKVQRILKEGQELEVFNILPELTSTEELNRKQRRKLQSSKGQEELENEGLIVTIKGPAIVMAPLAVYQ